MAEKVIDGQKAIGDFLEELATESPPLPAGGCAVALAVAMSAALEQFVTRLTIKKGKNPDSTVDLIEKLSRLKEVQKKCVEMMDHDVQAYERIMEANLLDISDTQLVVQQGKILQRLQMEGDDLYRKTKCEIKKRL